MQILVALLANGYELPLFAIPDAECQVWPIPQVLDMMDDHRRPMPTAQMLAPLAFLAVHTQHFIPLCLPFRPGVKGMLLALLYQCHQLLETHLGNAVAHAITSG